MAQETGSFDDIIVGAGSAGRLLANRPARPALIGAPLNKSKWPTLIRKLNVKVE